MKKERNLLNVSIDCVIFGFNQRQLKVLLIEQDKVNEKHTPLNALPGDHILKGEDLDDAASRILKELTGVDNVFLKQFKAFGNPERTKHPKDRIWLENVRHNPEAQIITIGYYSLVKMEQVNIQPSSFAKSAKWIDVKHIPELAFDHHIIIQEALSKLKKDTESYHIGFNLLPKKFTLSQIQELYETILDKEIDKRNFRKNIKKLDALIPLNEKQKGVNHKPAQYYTFNMTQNN